MYIYIYLYIYIYVYICVCMYGCMCVCVYVCMCVCLHVYICIYIWMYVCADLSPGEHGAKHGALAHVSDRDQHSEDWRLVFGQLRNLFDGCVLLQVLDLYWGSLESGGFWYKSRLI